MRQFFTASLFICIMASCAKDEIIHETLIIDGNEAPPITGVAAVTLNNYVNSLYIDLYGRTPTTEELNDAAAFLVSETYSMEARDEVIVNMMAEWEYYKNINLLTAQQFIVDVDSISMHNQIEYWEYLIDLYTDMGMATEASYYAYENERLKRLSTAHTELAAGEIGISTYFRRYIDNYFFDLVNMGSENFVIACFVHLLHRYPTDDEKNSGIAMVDGAPESLFLRSGSSKGDFMDIMTTTPEFYQGQVIAAFNTFLARQPGSFEMDTYGQMMQTDDHFDQVKIIILKSEEYAGF